jgi:hypothetical protein
LTQRTQLRHAHREAERAELKTLYQDFIIEASRLFVEAMSAKTDDISALVGLHALIGRLTRARSSAPTTGQKSIQSLSSACISPSAAAQFGTAAS